MPDRLIRITDHLVTAAKPAMSVQYAKRHLKSLQSSEDVLVAAWIAAATSYFEEQTGRQAITAIREAWLDAFPALGLSGRRQKIEIPSPPLQAVLSISYTDGDGVVQAFTDFSYGAPAGPYCGRGWVEPTPGSSWPIADDFTGAVKIQYRCGYGDTPDDVPALVTGILCSLVAHFDAYRGPVVESRGILATVPFGVQMMLDAFKYSAYPGQVLRVPATVLDQQVAP